VGQVRGDTVRLHVSKLCWVFYGAVEACIYTFLFLTTMFSILVKVYSHIGSMRVYVLVLLEIRTGRFIKTLEKGTVFEVDWPCSVNIPLLLNKVIIKLLNKIK